MTAVQPVERDAGGATARRWMIGAAAAVALGLAAAGALYLYRVNPESPGSLVPKCIFHEITGWHCAGCGSTRAVHALLHGELGRAIGFNPLLVMLTPVLGWMFVRYASRVLGGARPDSIGSSLKPRTIWLIGGVVVGFWVARNLPWWPFVLLAP